MGTPSPSAIAKSKATANKLAKNLPLDQLEAAIKKVSALMDDMGLTPSDLKEAGLKAKARVRKRKPGAKKTDPKKGTKVAPKYELKVIGETHRWTGRGRMPLVFKAYLEKGGLDRCLI